MRWTWCSQRAEPFRPAGENLPPAVSPTEPVCLVWELVEMIDAAHCRKPLLCNPGALGCGLGSGFKNCGVLIQPCGPAAVRCLARYLTEPDWTYSRCPLCLCRHRGINSKKPHTRRYLDLQVEISSHLPPWGRSY